LYFRHFGLRHSCWRHQVWHRQRILYGLERARIDRIGTAEQTLQQARPWRAQRAGEGIECPLLQTTEFAEQQRHLACLAGAFLQAVGKLLQGFADVARQG